MILVVADHANGSLSKSASELTTAARTLGREGPVTLLILGSGTDTGPAATEASTIADQVLVADHPALAHHDPQVWASAVAQVVREHRARTILIAASRTGRAYSPRVAIKLDAALLEDVIQLHDVDGALQAAHYTYLARVQQRIQTSAPVVVATIKPGAFASAAPLATVAQQTSIEFDLPSPRLQITGRISEHLERVALTDADIIVAGGRGLVIPEAFTTLVEGLADQLHAAVGATRAVVDAGWRPYAEQVGQTGKTVQPKLYIAIGISGAVQHLSGMSKSKLIVAINRDPDAPMIQEADYALIGDAAQIVPAIIQALRT